MTVIPGSSNSSHIQENLDLFDLELSEDEMEQIAALDVYKRQPYVYGYSQIETARQNETQIAEEKVNDTFGTCLLYTSVPGRGSAGGEQNASG